MTCSVVARTRIGEAIEELEQYEVVIDAKRVNADTRTGLHGFGLEVVCVGKEVPNKVIQELAHAELDVRLDLSMVQGNEFSEIVATP